MESFFAALNVVLPMTLLMALGVLIREVNLIDRPSMKKVDGLIFKIFMPTLLFKNIYEADLDFSAYLKPVIFTGTGLTVLFIIAVFLVPKIIKNSKKAAAISQILVRPNYLLYGMAVGEALYGRGGAGTLALMGAFIVPIINIFSALVLEIARSGSASMKKLFFAVLKNPMVIGAIAAFVLRLVPFKISGILWDVISDVASLTTTLSFISLGVGLTFSAEKGGLFPLIFGVIMRMVFIPAVFLPLAVFMGFHGQILCALMVFFGGPAAVASYPMAVAMDADGTLAAQLVCTTTIISIFTIFLYTFTLTSFNLL